MDPSSLPAEASQGNWQSFIAPLVVAVTLAVFLLRWVRRLRGGGSGSSGSSCGCGSDAGSCGARPDLGGDGKKD